jgi:hypothetical protein
MSAATITRDLLKSGTVILTISLPETFVRARQLLGDEFHLVYTYRIDRVENEYGVPTYFLRTLTDRPNGKPSEFVYTGIVHQRLGTVRLTGKSAFPAHATRYRVANRVLAALFAGRGREIDAAGWTVTAEVLEEAVKSF